MREKIPADYWRPVPCGHPADPIALEVDDGWVCHCGRLLDPGQALPIDVPEAPGPIVPCGKCGRHVAVPIHV